MQEKKIIIGLDLSLAKTGFCILDQCGKVLDSGIIKSKPSGDMPINETKRIVKIAEDIIEKINKFLPINNPAIIMIENLAFMARNTAALTQLAGLNHLVRILLNKTKWPWILVAPCSLKKFITGSGRGDKDQMMMHVYKNYGFESMDNNECDAYSLAVCGLAVLEKPIKKLGVPQKEVINLLKKQL